MKTLLFVCTGNICRSPLAAEYCRYLLTGKGSADCRIVSAGTHAVPGARAPAEAHEVAKSGGFDLANHRAQPLRCELINAVDLICVMEATHLQEVFLLEPKADDKVQRLTYWAERPYRGKDIPDPILRPLKEYYRAFDYILSGVHGLVKAYFPEVRLPEMP